MIQYLFIFLIVLVVVALVSKSIESHHSNWNTLIDNFDFSTKEFYYLLNAELKGQGVDKIKIETTILSEGGMLSSKREYLRLSWKEYQYDICGAPFGKGFFVSWWLLMKQSPAEMLVSKIPFLGVWLSRKFYPITYYKMDTASMFMTYAHQAVMNVIDQITKDKGVRALTENERKPEIRDLFSR